MLTQCIVCSSQTEAEIVATQIKGDSQNVLRAVRCAACGHVQLSPPEYDLGFYDEDGQIENVKKFYGTPPETLFRHAIIEARLRTERFARLGPKLGTPAAGERQRLLDVGGGYGFFGAQVASSSPDTDVVALEPSARRIEMGRERMLAEGLLPDSALERLTMSPGLLDDAYAEAHAGSFDVVTMWHVLEHVPRPVELLRLCERVLHPTRGAICIEVPNLDDELMRRSEAFRARWFMMEHISYFSPQGLAAVVRRALPNARIEVHGYQRYGIFNYMHWIAFNAPQGANPDLFEGTDRWWLEASWRAVREQTLCSDAIYMVIRPSGA
ncbi:class I SAM-dependent methyltransferase [Falsiroseomonas sp. E2-1-a20]|uniref:class I SAM-dependent methyltransferase n=1 Tax=Falsiroseomonas sp. E2-1-a20 TaxID=3239300 RepID=UPI003F3D50A0